MATDYQWPVTSYAIIVEEHESDFPRLGWIDYYNAHYLHSALGYKTPRQYEREYQRRHSSPFVAA